MEGRLAIRPETGCSLSTTPLLGVTEMQKGPVRNCGMLGSNPRRLHRAITSGFVLADDPPKTSLWLPTNPFTCARPASV